jgi:hypothetical protein
LARPFGTRSGLKDSGEPVGFGEAAEVSPVVDKHAAVK